MSSISYDRGFFWQTLWNHSSNADLKSERKDPNVLMEGDIIHIPDLTLKQESGATEKRHRFKKKGVPAKLRLRLLEANKPRANEAYRLIIDEGLIIQGTTDGEGKLEQSIPPDASACRLIMGDGQDEYTLLLGNLDPIDQLTGIQARLNSLGFFCGPVDGKMGADTRAAVMAFQETHGQCADGVPGPQTQAKLKDVYGA